jgi:transcriptional regulator with GAF, ATPase, and Fis domain
MIYYFHSSDGSTYSNDELEMKFKKGEGAIGRAWAKKNIVLYDREDERFRSSIKSVRLKKTALVSKTSSVLAVPILVTGKTVATLSLDSEFAINSTKFDQREITSLAQSHANGLAGLCFFNGVR